MKRRKFLQQSALISSSAFVPNFLQQGNWNTSFSSRTGKYLIIIQLNGGNDGLNTFVPYSNDLYYSYRKGLAIDKKDILQINQDMGMNPALAPIQNLFYEGEACLLNQVGYPNPNRSHFRSMDIWETGSGADEVLKTGWLGRYLDKQCPSQNPHDAIEIGNELCMTLKGEDRKGFVFRNIKALQKRSQDRFFSYLDQDHLKGGGGDGIHYLYKTLIDTKKSAAFLHDKVKTHRSNSEYPNSRFGKDLKTVAELVTSDSDTKIFYTSLGSFDTHVNQKFTQNRLLKQYAEGLNALVEDLKMNKLWDDCCVMTFSEFGRRVKKNASGGTDHGTANNVWLMGGKINSGGVYNAATDLTDLKDGDLKHKIDFRDIYADIINNWLDGNSKEILGRAQGEISLF